MWNEYSKEYCNRVESFSQPSLSRFLCDVNYEEVSSKFTQNERDGFESEWEKVKEHRKLNAQKNETQKFRQGQKKTKQSLSREIPTLFTRW